MSLRMEGYVLVIVIRRRAKGGNMGHLDLMHAIVVRAARDARRGDPQAQAWITYLRRSLAAEINEESERRALQEGETVRLGAHRWTPDGRMIAE